MSKISNFVTDLQNRIFESVISSNLIYNTCWEDPRIDRQLLNIDSDSRMVVLSSAGCNTLDYLLDEPALIHAVDINPAQNAVLELKKALFQNNNYSLLWKMFGEGSKKGADIVYRRKLRQLLPEEAQNFWDEKIDYFSSTSSESFYFRGTSGLVAKLIIDRIRRKGLDKEVNKMLDADSLEEQKYYFDEIEPQIWNTFSKWLVRRSATMAMLGVPLSQRQMIRKKYKGGMLEFIRKSLRRVFTKQTLEDNYFWRVYLTGSYKQDCCPNYLREKHFPTLAERCDRIKTHTTSLLQFLEQRDEAFSHFVLLDHQDWLAHAKSEILEKEWRQILDKSESGTRILFRSAGPTLDFLPDFVFDHVTFHSQKTESLQKNDRVGTYESTHLGIVE